VPESLKNLLLVMSTSGVLVDPSSPPFLVEENFRDSELDLWEITWSKISKFLPNLQDDLFPGALLSPQNPGTASHLAASLPAPTTPVVSPEGTAQARAAGFNV